MDQKTRTIYTVSAVIAAVIVIVTAAFLSARAEFNQTGRAIAVNCTSIENVQAAADRIYWYAEDVLTCIGEDGKQLWNHKLGADANYRVCRGGVAAWNGTNITVFDHSGNILHTGSMQYPIEDCAMCQTYAAVKSEGQLQVIEMNGKVVDTVSLTDDTLLDFGFFSDNDMMWLLLLNTDGTRPVTQVDTYRPARLKTGSMTDTDQLIYRVELSGSDLVLIGFRSMNGYSYKGGKLTSPDTLVYGWNCRDVCAASDAYVFAREDEMENGSELKNLRVIANGRDYRLHIPVNCMGVYACRDCCYGIGSEYAFKNPYASDEVYAYRLPVNVDCVAAVTDGGAALVVSDQKAYLIRLK